MAAKPYNKSRARTALSKKKQDYLRSGQQKKLFKGVFGQKMGFFSVREDPYSTYGWMGEGGLAKIVLSK